MKLSGLILAVLCLQLAFCNPAPAQRRREARESEGASKWAAAVQHPELNVRARAMGELRGLARAGENIDASVPVLMQIAEREIAFPNAGEIDERQEQAYKILTLVRPDFIAPRSAKHLAENFQLAQVDLSQAFAMQRLLEIDNVSVSIDALLQQALAKAMCPDLNSQKQRGSYEGELLHILARLAHDREEAGKLVLSRMRWPLGQSCYTRHHYQAVQLCAEQCGELLPALEKAYRADVERNSVLMMIAALAVYHDDAWKFFSNYLQDEFVNSYVRDQMVTAFADTWLLASEATQRASLEKMSALSQQAKRWQETRTTWGESNGQLRFNRGRRQDVMAQFRERIKELTTS